MIMVEEQLDLERKLDQIAELTQEIYRKHGRSFQPRYPRVLVYTCDRAQQVRGIFVPEGQNKTALEGIVLATWQPFIDEKGVEHVSEVEPGDHVMFPKHAGLPEGNLLPSEHFRIIKESDDPGVPGIMAIVKYTPHAHAVQQKLRQRLEDSIYTGTPNAKLIERLIEEITLDFVLVERSTPSLSLSGV